MQCRCVQCGKYKETARRWILQLPKGKCECGGHWEQCSWWKDEDGVSLFRNSSRQVFTLVYDREKEGSGQYYEVEQAQRMVTVWVIKKINSYEHQDNQ